MWYAGDDDCEEFIDVCFHVVDHDDNDRDHGECDEYDVDIMIVMATMIMFLETVVM